MGGPPQWQVVFETAEDGTRTHVLLDSLAGYGYGGGAVAHVFCYIACGSIPTERLRNSRGNLFVNLSAIADCDHNRRGKACQPSECVTDAEPSSPKAPTEQRPE